MNTNFNNNEQIDSNGKFIKNYKTKINFEVAPKNISDLLNKEQKAKAQSNDEKPFRLAEPVPIDLNIANKIEWNTEADSSYGKFTIKVTQALSTSINFDQFYLPTGTEMFIYNENAI
ncbi:MAG: hypothetical protein M9933_07505 [Chitinophagaceae bacterium]|nr:hypothetical protein [Chitinophagaceae bacterium]